MADVLADLLMRANARGALFAHSLARGPWAVRLEDDFALAAHAALAGEVWLSLPGSEPVRLLQGDVALVRGPERLVLGSSPGVPPVALEEAHRRWHEGGFRLVVPGNAAPSELICGGYRFDGGLCQRLLDCMPPVIHLRAGSLAGAGGLRAVLALLASELRAERPGQQTALDRMLDLLLIEALREWFGREETQAPSWFGAYSDGAISGALRLMHELPGDAWTVSGLASAVGLSRAAFSRRFAARVGEPPLGYLTRWRMSLAAELLRDSDLSLGGVAARVGYGSEFAFSTAFRRETGEPPGGFRRRERAAVLA